MTDLIAFASMPLDQLTTELEQMITNHHTPRRAYAARTTSPLATTPAYLPAEIPPRVVASPTFPMETA